MAYKRRDSKVFSEGEVSVTEFESVDPAMDFGGDAKLSNLKDLLVKGKTLQTTYNEALTKIDPMVNELNQTEKDIKKMKSRLKQGVGTRYGKDSSEYEMVGGTRTSEKKKSHPDKTQ
jgi:hypothetical protein